MLVGDTQRIWLYAEKDFAVPQDVPDDVMSAYDRLLAHGFTERLLPESAGTRTRLGAN